MKTHADIPLPTAVRTLVDLTLQSVGRGLRGLRHRHGEPEAMRASNAGAFATYRLALTIVRRLGRMLRHVLLILALRVPPPKARPTRTPAKAVRADGPRGATFVVAAPLCLLRDADAARAASPFAGASRNDARALARKIEALSRALRTVLPLARRLAGKLARDLVVIGWRPPKRPPRQRDFWEDLVRIWSQATFDLSTWRQWRRYANSS